MISREYIIAFTSQNKRMRCKVFQKFIVTFLITFAVVFFVLGAPSVVDVQVAAEGTSYRLYGDIIGLSIDTKGLIVEQTAGVLTKNGLIDTTAQSDLRKGDIILTINNQIISSAEDVEKYFIADRSGKPVNVRILREGTERETVIFPALDAQTGEYKLGLWARDHFSGIGTLTYTSVSSQFGALGHGVAEYKSYFPVSGGKIYPAEVLGIRRGKKGEAGSIQGTFSYYARPLGDLQNNSLSGVRGAVLQDMDGIETVFGGRVKAKKGRAQIISCISGSRKYYDIEITKVRRQNVAAEKGMSIRVTDSTLLAMTGGIVQGMSGSPIVQNGYWIGAVTHVLNESPIDGYAIYADWMIA